jgi:hypothetical protein
VRDWPGAIIPQIRDPIQRENTTRIDWFLRDLSRGIARISKGEVPDGSGDTIINQVISDLYWYLPGKPDNQIGDDRLHVQCHQGPRLSRLERGRGLR